MNLLRAIALLGLLFPLACSSTPMPAEGVTDDEVGAYREIFADDLRGEVEVERPVMQRTTQNQLKIVVPLRNVAGDDLRLLVQVQFLDELGAPSGDETNRQFFYLPRGTTKAFSATSRTSSARDYKMYIWRAEP